MILGSSEIFKRIENENLITNFGDDFKIEGCLVDLRLNEVFILSGNIFLYNDKRNTGHIHPIKPIIDNEKREMFVIEPREVYLVSTMETVNMPNDLAMYISRRSTIFRSGLSLDATFTNPGYHGPLTFSLINNNQENSVKIEKGFRIVQVGFFEIKGTCELYNGNWQGGKISSNGNFDPSR